jgi:phospholipase C
MWQQSDCNVSNATLTNPSGCLNDLYPFVATARDHSGSNSMGFYNMQNGDVPLLADLASKYTLSDNFHQSVMGGTAANHMALGTGDAIFRTTAPPPGTIANPNPTSATNDKYLVDQAWTNCSDLSQPGIPAIVNYLASLQFSPIPYNPSPNCFPGNYYMINNLSPGFLPNGLIDAGAVAAGTKVPPSSLRTIGDELNDPRYNISWKYYGGGYDAAMRVANGSMDPFDRAIGSKYCDICNFESVCDFHHGERRAARGSYQGCDRLLQ